MFAHFRPNEFLTLKFSQEELFIGYDVLRKLYVKQQTPDLARMIDAMEKHLFPKPQLTVITNYRLCETCCQEIDTRTDKYIVRTSEQGNTKYVHQECPPLKDNRP